jgi:hypothetical protein
MTKPSVLHLVERGRHTAELFDECDQALTALNESFGSPYEAARSNLTTDLQLAEASGLDLNVFQGSESLFKFPEFGTNIIVRVTKAPTGHAKLDKIDARIEKLERELKVARVERKKLVEQLSIMGTIDLITDKITTAFSRIK